MGEVKDDWVKVVTEMDMNNQKVKGNTLPSFRLAEAGDSGRRFMGLTRLFESAIVGLWDGFTSLAQPTAWREEGGEKKKTENDGRRRPSLKRLRPRRSPSPPLLFLFSI